jgi:hypothetical protein
MKMGVMQMQRKVLENVKMDRSWTSYIGASGGVLRAAGWWNEEIWKLMGMTGIGFHFIVHKTACPSSVTVYDWLGEHQTALDRIGIYSEVYQTDCLNLNTFTQIREAGIKRIKESINRGFGVIVWAPTSILEFGIIHGYDDNDRVFFVRDCSGKDVDPLLYTNLGKSECPMLFYQIVFDRVKIDREQIYRNSLNFAVKEWRKEHHIHPDYACGHRAYDKLQGTLERGDFNPFGLAYLLAVYGDAKENSARYLQFLNLESSELRGLGPAAELSGKLAEVYRQLTDLAPFQGSNERGGSINRENIPEIIERVKEAQKLEESAMEEIESVLG